ncbi:MAG: serine/threonine protein kinase [Planctomycetota bacterium]
MATNYDVQFLRLLLEQRRLSHEQALACLRQVDATQPPPTAFQLVVRQGLVSEAVARTAHVRVMAQFEQSGEPVAPMSAEAAARGVSDEVPVRAADPSQRYFDLSRAGENLEGYGLGPLIAHGTCYSSYRGRGPEGEEVRILTLSSRFEEHPQLLLDITAELRAWLGYRHPNGTGPVRLGRTHPRADRPAQTVAVYPASEGQTLRAFLKEHGALPVEEAVDLVLDLTELLANAHQKGLRLGDLRSDGVLYDGERAQVMDLGLARANCIAAGFGRLGLPFGNPAYLAPEVLQEGVSRPTPASDVYALGILFYELICGQLPYRAADPRQVLEQHFQAPLPPPPPEVDFSSAAAGVVLRMTAKAVEERAQDAAALVVALRNFRAGRPFRIPVGAPERSLGAGPFSADEWTEASTRAAAGEGHDWTESMIDRAPSVGPSELQPLASAHMLDLPVPQVTGRLPARLVAKLRAETDEEEQQASELQPVVEPAAADEPAPVVIGEKLGRGAVGATYEGTARGHDLPVVLKVISRKFSQHAEILEQIKDDLRAAAKLRHPNVLGVLEVIETEGRDLAVLERSSGKTLRALLKERGRLPVEEAVPLIRDVARALAAAERLGLHHGDLRSDKVYVEATRARLADFGHARGTCLGAGLGKYGLYFGHPCYLAPEVLQRRMERPTAQTDLYALGILFYEVVCGRRPFDEPGIKKNLLAHLKSPLPPPPSELKLPAALGDTLIRLTAKDPKDRIASVAALENALDGCLEASMASADVVGEASGTISAVTVEEFDPMASSMGEEARAQWGERSAVIGRPREGWTKEKIAKPQRVGPAWDAQATAGELYTDLEKALADAVKETPQERKQGQQRRAARAPGGAKAKGGGRQALVLGGALVGVVAVLGAAAAFKGSGSKQGNGGATTPTPGGSRVIATPDPNAGKRAEEEAEREREAVAKAIGDYEQRGRELLGKEAFAELFALAGEAFSTQRRNLPEVEKAVRTLEGEAQQKISARLAQDRKVFEQLVQAEDLGRAKRLLAKLRTWLPPRIGLGPLEKKLELALQGEEALLGALAEGPRRDADDLDRLLGRKLKGWGEAGRCYPNGGAVLAYHDPAELARDLLVVRGSAPVVENTPAGVAALKLSGGRRTPCVLAWSVPLAALAEGSVRVLPAPGAEVSLLLGVGDAGRNGLGISGQGELVTLGVRGVDGASPVKDPEEVELTLRCQRMGEAVQVEGESHGKAVKQVRRRVSAGEVRGRCGVSVRGEAWLLTLRVKAVVDPSYR